MLYRLNHTPIDPVNKRQSYAGLHYLMVLAIMAAIVGGSLYYYNKAMQCVLVTQHIAQDPAYPPCTQHGCTQAQIDAWIKSRTC
jgi:hypothetical protein